MAGGTKLLSIVDGTQAGVSDFVAALPLDSIDDGLASGESSNPECL